METREAPGPAISTVTPTKYSNPANPPKSPVNTIVVSLALRSLAFFIGLQAVSFFYAKAFYDSYIAKPVSSGFWDRVDQERSELWSVAEDSKVKSIKGFHHAFETVDAEDGKVRLHYITNSPASGTGSKQSKDLVILLHGWPDNCMVWRNVLPQLNREPFILIAPDIPGHGGSQSLPNYRPASVLIVLFHFIISMRRQHLSTTKEGSGTSSKVILVGHDWGAAISARLASETPELVDQVILTNGPIAHFAIENVKQHLGLSYTHFRAHNMTQAWQIARPYLAQVFLRSSYIWAFNLPPPLIRPLGTVGNMWFLRFIAKQANGTSEDGESDVVVRSLAEILGPNRDAAGSDVNSAYHSSVHERAGALNVRFFESLRLYREGLASGLWEQSSKVKAARALLTTTSPPKATNDTSNTLAATQPTHALKVPLTMLFCIEDHALDYRICVDGVEDYLCEDSVVLKFKAKKGRRIGHWTPITASDELTRAVKWVAGGKLGDLPRALGDRINVVDVIRK